jgi:hypothetical protein
VQADSFNLLPSIRDDSVLRQLYRTSPRHLLKAPFSSLSDMKTFAYQINFSRDCVYMLLKYVACTEFPHKGYTPSEPLTPVTTHYFEAILF